MSQVTLAECPIGLFMAGGELCLKTEYGNNEGRIDAYIVSSGEFFRGAAPQTVASQNAQLVEPVALDAILPLIDPAGGGEGKAVADVDNWGGRPTPAEAAALLRRYADKINLPPNDNNFADAAAVIDRLLVMVRAQNKYISALTLPPFSDSEKLIEAKGAAE